MNYLQHISQVSKDKNIFIHSHFIYDTTAVNCPSTYVAVSKI